jgi:hypothetical protein
MDSLYDRTSLDPRLSPQEEEGHIGEPVGDLWTSENRDEEGLKVFEYANGNPIRFQFSDKLRRHRTRTRRLTGQIEVNLLYKTFHFAY